MDTNRYLKAVNIEWDVDLAEDLDSLPKEVQIRRKSPIICPI